MDQVVHATQSWVGQQLENIGDLSKGDPGDPGPKGDPGDVGGVGPAGPGYTAASIDGSGNLVLTRTDGSTVTVGLVVGAPGAPGSPGTPGGKGDKGDKGDAGTDGDDGRGYVTATINSSGHLILTDTLGNTIDTGSVVSGVFNGTIANRPSAGTQGRLYVVTDDALGEYYNGLVYYDTGTSWIVFANSSRQLRLRADAPTEVPLALRAAAQQTGNLVEARSDDGTLVFSVWPNGQVRISPATTPTSLAISQPSSAGANNAVQQWQFGGTTTASVTAGGVVQGRALWAVPTADQVAIQSRSGSSSPNFDIQQWQKQDQTVLARVTADGVMRTANGATSARPSASRAGAGGMFFDTTLGKPIWSTGSAWVDATGATV